MYIITIIITNYIQVWNNIFFFFLLKTLNIYIKQNMFMNAFRYSNVYLRLMSFRF